MKKVYALIILQFLLLGGIMLHSNVTKISKDDIHVFGTFISEYNDHIHVLAKDEYEARQKIDQECYARWDRLPEYSIGEINLIP
jgi:hypothetical protein